MYVLRVRENIPRQSNHQWPIDVVGVQIAITANGSDERSSLTIVPVLPCWFNIIPKQTDCINLLEHIFLSLMPDLKIRVLNDLFRLKICEEIIQRSKSTFLKKKRKLLDRLERQDFDKTLIIVFLVLWTFVPRGHGVTTPKGPHTR